MIVLPNVFLTSDTHFGHGRIIELENRPFKDKEEMDEELIRNWNEVVGPDDLVFHLGDVFLCGAQKAEWIASRLNGRKILILGNHDSFSKTKYRKMGFDPHTYYQYGDFLLTHRPINEKTIQFAQENGLFIKNIHGHVHSMNQHLSKAYYSCACVELHDYKPVPLLEVLKNS